MQDAQWQYDFCSIQNDIRQGRAMLIKFNCYEVYFNRSDGGGGVYRMLRDEGENEW